MTFKEFIKTYGLIGYPIHKISKTIGKYTGNKSVMYDELLKKETAKYNEKMKNELEKLKNDNKNIDKEKEERDIINNYLSFVFKTSIKIMTKTLKDSTPNEEEEIIAKQSEINKYINKAKKSLRKNTIKDFYSEFNIDV